MNHHPASLLRELQGRARKRFGQHFLASPGTVANIVDLSELAREQRVLEIGPGLGVLTEALLGAGARVTAVELDRDLAAFLAERQAQALEEGRLALVEGDAARLDLAGLFPDGGAICVSNLPYNVGTRIITRLLGSPAVFHRLVVMVQREVADRLVARPGDSARGSLSVFVEARAEARIGLKVPPGAFYPPPKVASAVVRMDLRPAPATGGVPEAHFDRVVQIAFSQPRRMMRRVLADAWGAERASRALAEAGVDELARPGTLSLADFVAVARASLENGP